MTSIVFYRIFVGEMKLLRHNISVAVVAMLALFLFAHCGKSEAMKSIEATDAYVEENPDSAMRVLAALDTTGLRGTRERAAYAVALTNARWLASSPEFSDTLLRPFKTYFENSGPSRDKMLYCYLSGLVAKDKKQYSDAVLLGLEAADIAQNLEDYMGLGRAYRLLNDTYTDMWNGKQALKYSKLAYEAFMKNKSDGQAYWQLCSMAQACYNMNDFDNCRRYLDSLSNVSKEYTKTDVELADMIKRISAAVAREKGDYRACIDFIRPFNNSKYPHALFDLATSYFKIGNLDSARVYYDSLLKIAPSSAEVAVSLSLHDKDYKTAYEYTVKMLNGQTHVGKSLLIDNALGLEAEFHELKASNRSLQIRSLWMGIAAIIVICGLSTTFIVLRNRKNQQILRKDIESHISQSQRLKQEFDSLNQSNKLLENKYDETSNQLRKNIESTIFVNIATQLEVMVKLSDRAIKLSNKSNSGKDLLEFIKNFLFEPQNFIQFEKYADNKTNGVYSIFRKEWPDVSDDYLRIYLLKSLGVSNHILAFLWDTPKKNIYNRLYQIRTKVKERYSEKDAEKINDILL